MWALQTAAWLDGAGWDEMELLRESVKSNDQFQSWPTAS